MRNFIERTRDRIIWSWNGVKDAWVHQPSFRSWGYAYAFTIVLAFVLPLSMSERGLVLALGLMVLAFEAINTAVEYTVDYISTDRHPLAGRAKDAGSAAVFLASIAAGLAWVFVLIEVWGRAG